MSKELVKRLKSHYKDSTLLPDELEKVINYVLFFSNNYLFTLEFVKANNHCIICGNCCRKLNCDKLARNKCSIWRDSDYPELCDFFPYFDNGKDFGLVLDEDCNYVWRLCTKMIDFVIDEV